MKFNLCMTHRCVSPRPVQAGIPRFFPISFVFFRTILFFISKKKKNTRVRQICKTKLFVWRIICTCITYLKLFGAEQLDALRPIFLAHLLEGNFRPLPLIVAVHFIFIVAVLIFRGPIDTQAQYSELGLRVIPLHIKITLQGQKKTFIRSPLKKCIYNYK